MKHTLSDEGCEVGSAPVAVSPFAEHRSGGPLGRLYADLHAVYERPDRR